MTAVKSLAALVVGATLEEIFADGDAAGNRARTPGLSKYDENAAGQRCSGQPHVMFDRLDHRVHLPGPYLFCKAKLRVKPLAV